MQSVTLEGNFPLFPNPKEKRDKSGGKLSVWRAGYAPPSPMIGFIRDLFDKHIASLPTFVTSTDFHPIMPIVLSYLDNSKDKTDPHDNVHYSVLSAQYHFSNAAYAAQSKIALRDPCHLVLHNFLDMLDLANIAQTSKKNCERVGRWCFIKVAANHFRRFRVTVTFPSEILKLDISTTERQAQLEKTLDCSGLLRKIHLGFIAHPGKKGIYDTPYAENFEKIYVIKKELKLNAACQQLSQVIAAIGKNLIYAGVGFAAVTIFTIPTILFCASIAFASLTACLVVSTVLNLLLYTITLEEVSVAFSYFTQGSSYLFKETLQAFFTFCYSPLFVTILKISCVASITGIAIIVTSAMLNKILAKKEKDFLEEIEKLIKGAFERVKLVFHPKIVIAIESDCPRERHRRPFQFKASVLDAFYKWIAEEQKKTNIAKIAAYMKCIIEANKYTSVMYLNDINAAAQNMNALGMDSLVMAENIEVKTMNENSLITMSAIAANMRTQMGTAEVNNKQFINEMLEKSAFLNSTRMLAMNLVAQCMEAMDSNDLFVITKYLNKITAKEKTFQDRTPPFDQVAANSNDDDERDHKHKAAASSIPASASVFSSQPAAQKFKYDASAAGPASSEASSDELFEQTLKELTKKLEEEFGAWESSWNKQMPDTAVERTAKWTNFLKGMKERLSEDDTPVSTIYDRVKAAVGNLEPHWKLLGLSGPTRDLSAIQKAFRATSLAVHPDRNDRSRSRESQVLTACVIEANKRLREEL